MFGVDLGARSIVLGVTEIPEHLLKRSQQARSKASGEAAPAGDAPAAPASSAPATTSSSPSPKPAGNPAPAVAPAAPPPPKPDPPYVAAAKRRQKIPFWAMATLSILPVWVFMYARSLTPTEETVAGPLGEGAEVYVANCSSCHGAGGEGGIGYAFTGGEVLRTFPQIEDQLRFVYNGTVEYANAGIGVYGDPDREGGVHPTGGRGQMPGFGSRVGGALTDAQILSVVCHERFTLSGADPIADEVEDYERWCSPESPAYAGLQTGTFTFENLHEEVDGASEVGLEPAPAIAPQGGRDGGDEANEATENSSNAAEGVDQRPGEDGGQDVTP
jgi:mono/diheme cytochrome c family protein